VEKFRLPPAPLRQKEVAPAKAQENYSAVLNSLARKYDFKIDSPFKKKKS
jgi:hypothetical protein